METLAELSQLARAATADNRLLTVGIDEVVSKAQIRVRFRYIEELAASIRGDGLQSPIIVSPKNEQGKYVIQKGERRWRACKKAGLTTIDVLVRAKPANLAQEITGELIENIQRDNLSPLEIAHALSTLVSEGIKKKDIATTIGKANSYISDHIALLSLTPAVRQLAEAGICEDTRTLNNLRKLHQIDAAHCDRLCAKALATGEAITRKQSEALYQQAKSRARQPVSEAGPRQPTVPVVDEPVSEWQSCSPGQMKVHVTVTFSDQPVSGVLMLDRFSSQGDRVWVKLTGKRHRIIQVPVSDVQIKALSV